MFTGLSAFPLSPLGSDGIDEPAFIRLMARLVSAEVDSICALGSTGNYAYLHADQRARITRLAVEHAHNIPVIIGVGALTTDEVLFYVEDAQNAGAEGLLLPPMSYQPLQDAEVFTLYETVAHATDIPLCVYDNPTTTRFEFSDTLHAEIARLPHIGSIKIPGVPDDPAESVARVKRLKARIPNHVTVGVSGDAFAARGLNAGCDAWYSVIGGLFPEPSLAITRAAQAGEVDKAAQLCNALTPLWTLYKQHGGSLRVIASAAEQLGLVGSACLPRPLQALDDAERRALGDVLDALNLS
ncbi:dihydrodipicolinate synthase family protein [Salinisphaera sp. T5B8]|uniref:dihydrodipicolinate synthase family protein n=1 Tax=Salinisphaera sp. T5B8 TaxID=1304154 RepID=UPI003340F69C